MEQTSTPTEPTAAACDTCAGTGADPGAIDPFGEPCPDCKGSGKETVRA